MRCHCCVLFLVRTLPLSALVYALLLLVWLQGPFMYQGSFRPHGQMARDFTLFKARSQPSPLCSWPVASGHAVACNLRPCPLLFFLRFRHGPTLQAVGLPIAATLLFTAVRGALGALSIQGMVCAG